MAIISQINCLLLLDMHFENMIEKELLCKALSIMFVLSTMVVTSEQNELSKNNDTSPLIRILFYRLSTQIDLNVTTTSTTTEFEEHTSRDITKCAGKELST